MTEIFKDPISLRHEMEHDLHRPRYHFLPPKNWMNDPNGLCFFGSRYHLFYQFNPAGPLWGFMHWGHASSPDLIRWMDHPIALAPEESAGDELGCFSGCIVDDNGIPTAIYTGFVNFMDTPVMLARAKDMALLEWEKYPGNPVIAEKPKGVNSTDFRDPYVWRQGERWQMVIGAGMEDGSSAILLYESTDLVNWRYLGPAFKDKTLETVTMWECPNFLPLNGKYVLLVSLFPDMQGVYYYVGDYDGRRFTPEREGFLDRDGILYAPQVRNFRDGRSILFGWLREQRSDEAIEAAGWAGVMTLPRELGLDQRGNLISRPAVECDQLRKSQAVILNLQLNPGESTPLTVSGRQFELVLTAKRSSGLFELGILATPDETEVTLIGCDPQSGKVWLDTTRSSLSTEVAAGVQAVSDLDSTEEDFQLRVLVDGSVVEIWVNEAFSISGRVYPTLINAQSGFLRTVTENIVVDDVSIWTPGTIWEES